MKKKTPQKLRSQREGVGAMGRSTDWAEKMKRRQEMWGQGPGLSSARGCAETRQEKASFCRTCKYPCLRLAGTLVRRTRG